MSTVWLCSCSLFLVWGQEACLAMEWKTTWTEAHSDYELTILCYCFAGSKYCKHAIKHICAYSGASSAVTKMCAGLMVPDLLAVLVGRGKLARQWGGWERVMGGWLRNREGVFEGGGGENGRGLGPKEDGVSKEGAHHILTWAGQHYTSFLDLHKICTS